MRSLSGKYIWDMPISRISSFNELLFKNYLRHGILLKAD